jgi:hypothetical protein
VSTPRKQAAADDQADARAEELGRLQHWYDETQNPLYAWEAIAKCLHRDDPPAIPDWCVPYLRDVANNIFELTRHRDFRRRGAKKLSHTGATRLVAEALRLVRRGSRNAFSSLANDQNDMRDANSVSWKFGPDPMAEIAAARRSVSQDRAQRIVSRGKRLHRTR